MKEVVIKVEGMMCDGCKSGVEKALNAQPGVREAVVDLKAGTAAVKFDEAAVTPEQLRAAVEDVGYDASV